MPIVSGVVEPLTDVIILSLHTSWAFYHFLGINPYYFFICHIILNCVLDYINLRNIQVQFVIYIHIPEMKKLDKTFYLDYIIVINLFLVIKSIKAKSYFIFHCPFSLFSVERKKMILKERSIFQTCCHYGHSFQKNAKLRESSFKTIRSV